MKTSKTPTLQLNTRRLPRNPLIFGSEISVMKIGNTQNAPPPPMPALKRDKYKYLSFCANIINTHEMICGRAIEKQAIRLPYFSIIQPYKAVPNMLPGLINDATHDIWSMLKGPDGNGVFDDCRIGMLGDGQPNAAPNDAVTNNTETRWIFNFSYFNASLSCDLQVHVTRYWFFALPSSIVNKKIIKLRQFSVNETNLPICGVT